jgi:hypothetical protein
LDSLREPLVSILSKIDAYQSGALALMDGARFFLMEEV